MIPCWAHDPEHSSASAVVMSSGSQPVRQDSSAARSNPRARIVPRRTTAGAMHMVPARLTSLRDGDQSPDAAVGGRHQHRTDGIGARTQGRAARDKRRAGAAAQSVGDVVQVLRITAQASSSRPRPVMPAFAVQLARPRQGVGVEVDHRADARPAPLVRLDPAQVEPYQPLPSACSRRTPD